MLNVFLTSSTNALRCDSCLMDDTRRRSRRLEASARRSLSTERAFAASVFVKRERSVSVSA